MFGNPGETLVLVFKIALKMRVFTSPQSHNSTKFAVYLAVNRKPVSWFCRGSISSLLKELPG